MFMSFQITFTKKKCKIQSNKKYKKKIQKRKETNIKNANKEKKKK